MSGSTGNRPTTPHKDEHKMLVGVLVGVVVGVGVAAGLAWYLMKSPAPFLKKSPFAEKLPVTLAPQNPPSGAGKLDDKPRFEFYKVLTDKQDSSVAAPARTPKASSGKTAPYIAQQLQVGSFQNPDDAEKLKAKLALLGVEAIVQSATIPEKGVWYRVRLGPYKSENEMVHARNFLQQNGVESTPMRAQ